MIKQVTEIIKKSKYLLVFTGAGISVESGIPPFRGELGVWNRYDPELLNIDYFHKHTVKSWSAIREIFYDYFTKAKPNKAHFVLSKLEELGIVKAIVTQNIDNLHFEAGSKNVYEFHGNSRNLKCTQCNHVVSVKEVSLVNLPPLCVECNGILKPDFVFFGEGIPTDAYSKSFVAARKADVVLVIGSTGEVMPACTIPYEAKRNGAIVIEINPDESNFSCQITDYHIKTKATEAFKEIENILFNK